MLIVDRVTKSYRTLAASCRFSPAFRCRWSAARRSRSWGHRAAGKHAPLHSWRARSAVVRDRYARREGSLPDGRARAGGFPEPRNRLRLPGPSLSPQCSVLENVLAPTFVAPASSDGADAAATRAHALLTQVGLGDRLDHRPAELSGERNSGPRLRGRSFGIRRCCSATSPPATSICAAADTVADLLLKLHADRTRSWSW